MVDIRKPRTHVGANIVGHSMLAESPKVFLEIERMQFELPHVGRKRKGAPLRGHAQEASRHQNAPRCAREKPQGIESLLAQLHLIENDKSLSRFDRLPLVLGNALDEAVDVIGWPVEQGARPSKIGLEVQLHETALEQLAAHALGEHGLTDATSPLNEQRLMTLRSSPFLDGAFQFSTHIVHGASLSSKRVYLHFQFHVQVVHRIPKFRVQVVREIGKLIALLAGKGARPERVRLLGGEAW